MAHSTLRAWSIWLSKANIGLWAINGVLLAVLILSGFTLTGLLSSSFFSKLTLLETGIVLLIAGIVAFSGSVLPSKAREQIFKSDDEEWSIQKLRKSEKKANKFVIFALMLFLESLFVSFLGV